MISIAGIAKSLIQNIKKKLNILFFFINSTFPRIFVAIVLNFFLNQKMNVSFSLFFRKINNELDINFKSKIIQALQ